MTGSRLLGGGIWHVCRMGSRGSTRSPQGRVGMEKSTGLRVEPQDPSILGDQRERIKQRRSPKGVGSGGRACNLLEPYGKSRFPDDSTSPRCQERGTERSGLWVSASHDQGGDRAEQFGGRRGAEIPWKMGVAIVS